MSTFSSSSAADEPASAEKGDLDFLNDITPLGLSPESDHGGEGGIEGSSSSPRVDKMSNSNILAAVDAVEKERSAVVDTPLVSAAGSEGSVRTIPEVATAAQRLMGAMDAESGTDATEKETEAHVTPVSPQSHSVFEKMYANIAAKIQSDEDEIAHAGAEKEEGKKNNDKQAQEQVQVLGETPIRPLLRLALAQKTSYQDDDEYAEADGAAMLRLQVRQQIAEGKYHWEKVSKRATLVARRRLASMEPSAEL
jgi:hypothetical protein